MTKNTTIRQIKSDLATKKYSVSELINSYLEKIKSQNPNLNAFITVSEREAKEKAVLADKEISNNPDILNQKPLFGIPVAHKDIFLTRDLKTTAGSKLLENFIPQYSGTVVKKLETAGAITLGKLNCDAWAHGASGENSNFGPTKNPYDLSRVSGGSSSGSAAAVAGNLTPFATATDTGGSIRQPANFCGVVGLKPTYGRVSRYGVIAMASSLDSIGHVTQDVYDSALILETTAGHDPHDANTPNIPVPRYTQKIEERLPKLKIGIPKEYLDDLTDPDVINSLEIAKKTLQNMGIDIIDISLPHTKYSIAVYYIIQPAEVSSNLARFDGLRFGHERQIFGNEAKRRIMIGTYTLSAGYYDAYYLQALKVRHLIKNDFDHAFESVDAILAPVSPTPAFKIGEKALNPLSMYLADIFTASANLAGLPGIALPTGFSKNNLPLGIQFLSKSFSEEKLLHLAYQFEQFSNA
jgi:aspartyl-tRNA(Asn)/glutamyl-tRNA(Gln) amidotransferase subunit A